ncbi:MAG TPA: hypothetical protein VI565_06585 [Burkholderiales bacterium]|nr:hypothetical protein [Burkholderiales bacterium]
MAHDEGSLIDDIRKAFTAQFPMAWCVKLHGGPFSAGLPDLLVAMERHAALVEAKWLTDAEFERPLATVIAKKLTEKQALNLGLVGALDGPLRARVLVGGEVSTPDGRALTLVVGLDAADALRIAETKVTALDIASELVTRRDGANDEAVRRAPWPAWARLLQAQVRPRGSEWHAGYLLCGPRYFGPIAASTDKDKTFDDA